METFDDSNDQPGTPDTIILEDPDPMWLVTARNRGDFGCLIPVGRESILAFHAVAARSKLDPEFPEHCQQFMFTDEEQTEYTEQFQDSGPETETDDIEPPRLIWRGYFKFNASTMPRQCIVGCGRRDMPHFGVDMLLALPQSRSRHKELGRHSRHAVFYHQSSSGAFMISIERGKDVHIGGEKQKPQFLHIGMLKTNIRFGDLDCYFQYTGLDDETYRAQLFPRSLGPPRSLGLTPNESDREVGGVVVRNPFAKGTFGVVLAGTQSSTGKLVALKRVQRTPESLGKLRTEVEILQHLARHRTRRGHQYICHLIDVIYLSGDECTTGPSGLDDVFLVFETLAPYTLYDLITSNCTYGCRKLVTLQLLLGLDFIHNLGLMHRDIKPTNILVLSYDPPHVAYTDLGCATSERTSTDHWQGTVAYLAPEILQLKAEAKKEEQKISGYRSLTPRANDAIAAEPYTNAVDIYALGVTVYQLILQKPCTWKSGITSDIHRVVLEELKDIPDELCQQTQGDALVDLVGKMVAWESAGRPTTQDLLSHPMWTVGKSHLEEISKKPSKKRQRT